jgi:predicted molibdopterin-dependent oxidoreductase YjgC
VTVGSAPLVQLGRPDRAPAAMVELTIDGQRTQVAEGTTILTACAGLGITIPTLCFLETLKPVNVCRLCVVEVEGARVLVPSCSRPVEAGMTVHTRSERVRLTRGDRAGQMRQRIERAAHQPPNQKPQRG